jgi:hypothetical protein
MKEKTMEGEYLRRNGLTETYLEVDDDKPT